MNAHGEGLISTLSFTALICAHPSFLRTSWSESSIELPPEAPFLFPRSLMEHIWSPWRYKYVATADGDRQCVLCRVQQEGEDSVNFVIHRASLTFVILNLYPYTSGHLMIVPYEHTASLGSVSEAVTTEMMSLTKKAQSALEAEYHPDGFNIGMNLGRSAGAGVADHIHLHVVPRWVGDANFVSVIGETRVLPEDLGTTYDKLKKRFDSTG